MAAEAASFRMPIDSMSFGVDENVFRCRIAVDHVKRGRCWPTASSRRARRSTPSPGAPLVWCTSTPATLPASDCPTVGAVTESSLDFTLAIEPVKSLFAHRCVTHDDHLGDLFVLLRQRDVDGRWCRPSPPSYRNRGRRTRGSARVRPKSCIHRDAGPRCRCSSP